VGIQVAQHLLQEVELQENAAQQSSSRHSFTAAMAASFNSADSAGR
jgi:hypothetical protein